MIKYIPPYTSPPYTLADARAIQCVFEGTANDEQQKRAMRFIITEFCGSNKMEFYSGGEEGRRDSDFAGGKRWVGLQLAALAMEPVDQLKERLRMRDAVATRSPRKTTKEQRNA